MKSLPRGLWPVMLTPFDKSNHVDIAALKDLTQFYLGTGAAGLFANCLSSEMMQLSMEERLMVTKTVMETVQGKIPVIATGTFGSDLTASIEFSKKLHDIGVEAVVINTNQFCTELDNDDVFKRQMNSFLEKSGNIPLGLYECPDPYKRLMSPEMLQWLAQSGRFLYHKDTCCDLHEIQKKILVTENTPLGVYNAHVPTGVDSIRSGAQGLSPIAANFYPELFSYQLKQLDAGNENDPLRRLNIALDIMDTVIHYNYPYSAKLFLQKRGMKIRADGRIPRLKMSVHNLRKLDLVMASFKELSQTFEIETYTF